ncbi:hypothetical protein [Parasitella parasitica]|uniref:Uncharacterized protein n=1 Tax=Parasitella parasitica TaxID=35722 RepID=A0A0B7NFJ1_9FUNG|nr:hypothetical protein [Parasitella parasitica]
MQRETTSNILSSIPSVEGDDNPVRIKVSMPVFKEFDATDIVERAQEAVKNYIKLCRVKLGITVDRRISDYLYLVASNMPMKHYVISQFYYKSEILPRYASAFAYDPFMSSDIPPTLQVLSQFICLDSNNNDDVTIVCNWLSMSYVLVFSGVMFSNCTLVDERSAADIRKMHSYFAALCSSFISLSVESGVTGKTVSMIGDIAKIVSEGIRSSLSKETKLKTSITWRSFKHPVWISRSIMRYETEYFRPNIELLKCNSAVSGYRSHLSENVSSKTYSWKVYAKEDLKLMGNHTSLKWLVDIIGRNDINVHKAKLLRFMNANQGNYRANNGNSNNNSESGQASFSRNTKDNEVNDYIRSMISSMYESTKKTQEEVEKISEAITKMSVSSTIAGEVEELEDLLRTASTVIIKTMSLYAAIPGVLTSTSSATSITSKKLAPVIQTTNGAGS